MTVLVIGSTATEAIKERLRHRLLGTALGLIALAPVALLLPGGAAPRIAGLVIVTLTQIFTSPYWLQVAFTTVAVVLLAAPRGDFLGTSERRLLYTLIAAALLIVVAAVVRLAAGVLHGESASGDAGQGGGELGYAAGAAGVPGQGSGRTAGCASFVVRVCGGRLCVAEESGCRTPPRPTAMPAPGQTVRRHGQRGRGCRVTRLPVRLLFVIDGPESGRLPPVWFRGRAALRRTLGRLSLWGMASRARGSSPSRCSCVRVSAASSRYHGPLVTPPCRRKFPMTSPSFQRTAIGGR